jgi:hypothetical protein
MESDTTQYSLEVESGDSVAQWSLIELEPEETWEDVVEFSGNADIEVVRASLYRLDESQETAYRNVVLWLGTD